MKKEHCPYETIGALKYQLKRVEELLLEIIFHPEEFNVNTTLLGRLERIKETIDLDCTCLDTEVGDEKD